MNFTHELSTSPNLVSNVTFYIPVPSFIMALASNIILGLPINSYVLWLICMGKGSGIVAEFFSLNLTICEILYCLFSFLIFVGKKYKELLYITCFIVALPCVGRPLINCVICVERYLAVLHPISFLKYKPLRYRLVCSAVIWMMVVGSGVLFLFVLYNHLMCVFIAFYLLLYLVLLSIKLYCCLTIVRALKYPGPGEKGKEAEKANNVKKKAITFILIITVTMLIQYMPVIFIGLLYNTLYEAGLYLPIGVLFFLMFGYASQILYIYRVRNL